LAKYKKRQVQIQEQLIKERGINVNDLQALHKAIQDSEQQAKQEFGL
jgi:fructosamine-3-kinase